MLSLQELVRAVLDDLEAWRTLKDRPEADLTAEDNWGRYDCHPGPLDWFDNHATGRMAFLFAFLHDKPPQECINKQPQMLPQQAPPDLSKQIYVVFDFLFMSSKHGMQRNFDQIGSFISFSYLNMTSIPF
jgi:hypothetical protein